jgi:hypothetical protein
LRQLSERKTRLIFETGDIVFERGRWRQVIVEARPTEATIRLKGMRASYVIDYASIYSLAVKRATETERIARATSSRPVKRGRPRKQS